MDRASSQPVDGPSGGGSKAGARLPGLVCQVAGCGTMLLNLREYYQRYRVCEYHVKLDYLEGPNGELQRFCQQCGRFQPLSAFDDNKRSCRERLARHNARRKKRLEKEQARGASEHSGRASQAMEDGTLASVQQQAAGPGDTSLLQEYGSNTSASVLSGGAVQGYGAEPLHLLTATHGTLAPLPLPATASTQLQAACHAAAPAQLSLATLPGVVGSFPPGASNLVSLQVLEQPTATALQVGGCQVFALQPQAIPQAREQGPLNPLLLPAVTLARPSAPPGPGAGPMLTQSYWLQPSQTLSPLSGFLAASQQGGGHGTRTQRPISWPVDSHSSAAMPLHQAPLLQVQLSAHDIPGQYMLAEDGLGGWVAREVPEAGQLAGAVAVPVHGDLSAATLAEAGMHQGAVGQQLQVQQQGTQLHELPQQWQVQGAQQQWQVAHGVRQPLELQQQQWQGLQWQVGTSSAALNQSLQPGPITRTLQQLTASGVPAGPSAMQPPSASQPQQQGAVVRRLGEDQSLDALWHTLQ